MVKMQFSGSEFFAERAAQDLFGAWVLIWTTGPASQGDPVFSSALVHAVLERNLVDLGIRRVGDVISRGNMGPQDVRAKSDDLEKAFQLGINLVTMTGMR